MRDIRPGLWNISLPPENVEIDLFYVNHVFDPPISGIIRFAMREGDRISSINHGTMPVSYIVCWKNAASI